MKQAAGDRFRLDRAAFLAGSLAAIGAGFCDTAFAAEPATSTVPPENVELAGVEPNSSSMKWAEFKNCVSDCPLDVVAAKELVVLVTPPIAV